MQFVLLIYDTAHETEGAVGSNLWLGANDPVLCIDQLLGREEDWRSVLFVSLTCVYNETINR